MMEDFGRRKEDWILEDSPDLRGIVALDLKLKNMNNTWERVLGYPPEMLLGKPLTRLVDQNEHEAALMLVNARLAVEKKPIEFSLRCKDGSYRCFVWERRPARGEEGMVISGRDITERKRMETTANLQEYLRSKKARGPL